MKNNVPIIITIFIIAIVLLIIIPLPSALLDVMFVINIGVSFMIFLISMNITHALQFSIFPSLLLVTTVFRVALNISSTRLILSNGGEAGKIIQTFGNFVLQGNAIVGFLIFIIIFLVQFMVISKGSERVAEVAARFTLDAMPGKQMAIDADLSSGIITEDEARKRRSDVQREADFFGSMDGATKFVKGDSIVSIIITIINLVGGIVIGMLQGGMDITQVLNVYSLATVGDGLVSQLPSLLISVATGMIVTRSASENSLSIDIQNQFFSQPNILIMSGGAILSLMLFRFPPVPLIVIGGGLIFFGITLRGKKQKAADNLDEVAAMEGGEQEVSETAYYRNIENIYPLINVEPIEIEFGYSLVPLVDERSGGSLVDRVVMFRRQFASDMGMVVPSVRILDNGFINPNQYIIKLKGEEVSRGEVLVDYLLALDSGRTNGTVDGIDTIEPAYGIPSKWITEDLRETAEVYGYTVIDPLSVIVTHLSEVIRKHAHELLTRQDVNLLLENAKKNNPATIEALVPAVIPVVDLQKVLQNLLSEGVPIKDLETILETMGDYYPTLKDTDMLTEYVRQALKRTITHRYSDNGQIKVITLDPELEKIILAGVKKNEHGSYLAIEPDIIQKMVSNLIEQTNKVKEIVNVPIVLTSPVVRIYFKKIVDQFCPNTTVLSFSEIENNVQIQALGDVSA